MKRRCNLN